MERAIDIFIQLASTSIAAAAVAHYFNKRLEKLKTDFQYAFFQFSTVHTKRIEVLSDIYAKLVKTQRQFNQVIHPGLPVDNNFKALVKEASQTAKDFSDYSAEHALFLPKKMAQRVRQIDKELSQIWFDFQKGHPALSKASHRHANKWDEAWDSLSESIIPDMLGALEAEMRKLIGVR